MPVKYVCRSCGFVIYEFDKVGSSIGLLSPLEVAKLHGYVCPACKSQLKVPMPGVNFREFVHIHVRIPERAIAMKSPLIATAPVREHVGHR